MTRRHRTTVPTLAAALATVLLTAACGGGGGEPEESGASADVKAQVEVTGDFGSAPDVTIDAPLQLDDSTSWVVEEGEGDTVESTSTTILQLTILNGQSGEPAISTYDEGQAPQEVALGQQVFPSLVQGLVGQRAGSRVVVASTGDDAYGPDGSPQIGLAAGDPVVIVADVLSTDPTKVLDGPDGETVAPQAGAPTLVEADGVPTGFTTQGPAPTESQRFVLVQGDGPVVEDPDRVSVDYLGQVYGSDAGSFDDSYSRGEPTEFSVGLGRVIPCWDSQLTGVAEGSRVILVCPPDQAYGEAGQGEDIPPSSTLVFVVDVLGVG